VPGADAKQRGGQPTAIVTGTPTGTMPRDDGDGELSRHQQAAEAATREKLELTDTEVGRWRKEYACTEHYNSCIVHLYYWSYVEHKSQCGIVPIRLNHRRRVECVCGAVACWTTVPAFLAVRGCVEVCLPASPSCRRCRSVVAGWSPECGRRRLPPQPRARCGPSAWRQVADSSERARGTLEQQDDGTQPRHSRLDTLTVGSFRCVDRATKEGNDQHVADQ
jgi:hypothetical protein